MSNLSVCSKLPTLWNRRVSSPSPNLINKELLQVYSMFNLTHITIMNNSYIGQQVLVLIRAWLTWAPTYQMFTLYDLSESIT